MAVLHSNHSSTTQRHFDYAQKVFQIGENGNLGITMWGLGNVRDTSYRTLIARFSDQLQTSPAASMVEIAQRWSDFFYAEYQLAYQTEAQRLAALETQATRTLAEDDELDFLRYSFSGGFCIGGQCPADRTPRAFEVSYSLDQTCPPAPVEQGMSTAKFWGCPNLIERLLYGIDLEVLNAISKSPHWTGNQNDLMALILPNILGQPVNLPIREAIDWVHASIYCTIKTMKFSHLAPVCGGPIEIAVITTDRPFRWVEHKSLDAAYAKESHYHV